MGARNVTLLILGVVALIVFFNALYTVDETEQAIITQFGDPVGDPVVDAGLHAKIPFIQKVTKFEKRLLEWDGDENQIPTSDKKYIWVDTFARWKIVDPLKFYQSVNNERNAQSRLDDIIDGVTRDFITENPLIEAVRNTNREMETVSEGELQLGVETDVIDVEMGRLGITRQILDRASELAPEYGIELVDVRIKRINYIEDVRRKVYERMISERKRIAEKYRSEGQGEKAEIEGEREKELKAITSEAYRRAQEIEGEADAEATKIYAGAFSRDPEFYSFLRTMEAYRSTLDQNTMLILNTDSEFLKYLKQIRD
jgi:membrane protease subunit HflC